MTTDNETSFEPASRQKTDLASGVDDPYIEINALLGRGTRYQGKLYFDGRARIEGQFDGEIKGEDVLVIGEGAVVHGTIEVGSCIVTGGSVSADIRARNAIELHDPAIVKGNLHAPNIFIDRGVQFQGGCKMEPLDEPGSVPTNHLSEQES